MNKRHIENVLLTLGVDVDTDPRWDDAATAIFAEQLEQIEQQLYEVVYPEQKGLSLQDQECFLSICLPVFRLVCLVVVLASSILQFMNILDLPIVHYLVITTF